MRVVVNGEERDVPGPLSVAALLEHLGVATDAVAVEVNGRVVPRAEHSTEAVREGDRLEIVSFVGGG